MKNSIEGQNNSSASFEPDLSVKIGSLKMANPVGVASGIFGYGEEYKELVNIDKLGALYTNGNP